LAFHSFNYSVGYRKKWKQVIKEIRVGNKPKLARDKKAEILRTVGSEKSQFMPSKKDLVTVCSQ